MPQFTPLPPAQKVKKSFKQVKDAANLFQGQSYTDVLNKLWRMGYRVETLVGSLAQDAQGTNDVTDIITRLVNSGVDINEFRNAATMEIESNLPVPFKPRDPTSPFLPGSEVQHNNPSPPIHARGGPGADPNRIGNEKLAPAPIAPGNTGTGNRNANTTVKAPPLQAEAPKSQEQIREFIRKRYGGYAALLDDPNFAEIQKVLEDGAREEWDDATIEAQIKSTPWWQQRGEKAAEWDVLAKSHGAEAEARLNLTIQSMTATAKRLGVPVNEARFRQIATEAHRAGWAGDGNKISSAVAAEAEYTEDYSGDIGAYETGIKSVARDFLMPLTDKEAFDMARRMAMGELSVDAVPEHFRTLAKGAMPTFAAQIDQGLKPRELLAQHTSTIAKLLEVDPETVDYLGDSRFTGIISHAGEKGELRPMTLSETSKHVKGLDDYWKTSGAGKEVSGIIQTLGRSFGKIA